MVKVAVLTGDVVQSTQLSNSLKEKLEQNILDVLEDYADKTLFSKGKNYFFYRGDSLQIVIRQQDLSLRLALLLRLGVKRISASDIRFSIGIGEMDVNTGFINQSTGSAFLFSGKTLDEIGNERLAFKSANKKLNREMNMSFRLLETILYKWSQEMSEAVYYQLKGFTQKQTAEKLNRSQVAISKRLQAAHYEEVKLFLTYYEETIRSL